MKKYTYLIVIFLIVASSIAYSRILTNDFINFDDDKYITENNHIKSGINAKSIKWAFTTTYFSYWHPLTWLSIMLDWNLFGANASGHHLVSLLWHIGSAILLFLFLSKTTGSLLPSVFVAAFFALHPLRVESVAWASERKDVLSVFFGLASLYTYAYYAESSKVSKYFLCLILFALSLISKPMLVTLPFVMLLLDYWPLGRWPKYSTPMNVPISINKGIGKKKNKKRKAESYVDKKIAKPIQSSRQLIGNLLWEKVPFFFLAIILSITLICQQQSIAGMASLQQIPFSNRIMNTIVSYVSYLGKIFWPVDLAIFYPYLHSFSLGHVFVAALILLGISITVILTIRRTPFLFVGWFWYLGVLFPVIGLMQAGAQAMADRYTYFPSIGIAIMLTWGVVYLLPQVKLRKIIMIPAAIILAALTFLTWQQCGYWKNSIELFNHALQVTKDNYLAHHNFGIALAAEGKNEEAIAHYLKAIEINPDFPDAHFGLGVALAAQGKNEEAIAHYLAGITINPYHADAHYDLGTLLAAQGKNEAAIAHYLTAIKINPDDANAHHNLADVFVKQNNIDQAIEHFREAVRITPSSFTALNNLGVNLERQLKHDEAIYYYRRALQLEPKNPGIYFNLGVALGNKGELKEAIESFRTAIYLKPDYEEARRALRLALDIQQRQKS